MSSNPLNSHFPRLALNSSGFPAIAWLQDTPTNKEVYFKRWNGQSWEELAGSGSGGGVSATAGDCGVVVLTVDASDNPFIAWTELVTPTNFEVYIKKWNGLAWTEIGGSATGGGISNSSIGSYVSDIALDGSGNPVVLWTEAANALTSDVYLKRWDGTAWVEVGGSATNGGVSESASRAASGSLALDAAGKPSVVWLDKSTGTWKGCFKRWNGSIWETLGVSPEIGDSFNFDLPFFIQPSLRLSSMGSTPHVAWTTPSEVFYAAWNGASWSGVDGSATGRESAIAAAAEH